MNINIYRYNHYWGESTIKKNLIFIILTLFILLNLSCVSSACINETSDNIEVPNENNNDFSALSLEINKSSESKEIKLTKDYIYHEDNDKEYYDGIDINIDDFIIDGQGHTIDGNKKARIFKINSKNVILKNINLVNGYSSTYGGAIYWHGENGTIIDSFFKDCTSSRYGGAVSFKCGGIIENSNFDNNKAGTGGAIDFGDESKIINSKFTSNFATFQGGALYFFGKSTIRDSTFIENVGGDGGGIYFASICNVENSTFMLNNAIGYGGGIYLYRSGIVNNSTFTQNTAKLEGGAVFISSDNPKIFNTEFNYNTAKEGKSIYITAENVKLCNLTFNDKESSFKSEIYIKCKNLTTDSLSFNNLTKTSSDENKPIPTQYSPTTFVMPSKIIIKKKTSLKAKSKTFKSSKKPKRYIAILKSGKTLLKWKKLKLTVNGKTYIKKTDGNGKAKFTLKINKKGTYKVKIKFDGDNIYKSSKKSVKIKIK